MATPRISSDRLLKGAQSHQAPYEMISECIVIQSNISRVSTVALRLLIALTSFRLRLLYFVFQVGSLLNVTNEDLKPSHTLLSVKNGACDWIQVEALGAFYDIDAIAPQ